MSRGVDLSIEVGQMPSSPHPSVATVFGNLVHAACCSWCACWHVRTCAFRFLIGECVSPLACCFSTMILNKPFVSGKYFPSCFGYVIPALVKVFHQGDLTNHLVLGMYFPCVCLVGPVLVKVLHQSLSLLKLSIFIWKEAFLRTLCPISPYGVLNSG